jgi:hypothetical protein
MSTGHNWGVYCRPALMPNFLDIDPSSFQLPLTGNTYFFYIYICEFRSTNDLCFSICKLCQGICNGMLGTIVITKEIPLSPVPLLIDDRLMSHHANPQCRGCACQGIFPLIIPNSIIVRSAECSKQMTIIMYPCNPWHIPCSV